MNTISIATNDLSINAPVEVIDGILWTHINGVTYSYNLKQKTSSLSQLKTPQKSIQKTITAPMPGKILSVHVEPGTSIKNGTVAVVLEAMKMEYSLKSSATCTVKSVFCKPGDQVCLGQILVEFR